MTLYIALLNPWMRGKKGTLSRAVVLLRNIVGGDLRSRRAKARYEQECEGIELRSGKRKLRM